MTLRLRLSAALLASSVALVGCGGSDGSSGSDDGVADLSATKILEKAEAQLAKEEFVTVKGAGKDDKDDTEIEVDISFAGETAEGTIAVEGAEFQLLKADGKSYFKASDEFFRAQAGAQAEQIIDVIDGRWVVADPADPNFEDIASFTTKDGFAAELLEPDGKIKKGKEKKVNGVDCIGLEDGSDSIFYFDKKDGKPISLVSGKGEGSLDFTYDEVETAEAPAKDDVVDLAELGGA